MSGRRRAVFKSSEATGRIIEIFTLKLFDAALVSSEVALFLTELFYWRHPEWLRRKIRERYERLRESGEVREIVEKAARRAREIVRSSDAYGRAEAEARASELLEEAERRADLAALVMAITDVHSEYGFSWVIKVKPSLEDEGTIVAVSELEGGGGG